MSVRLSIDQILQEQPITDKLNVFFMFIFVEEFNLLTVGDAVH